MPKGFQEEEEEREEEEEEEKEKGEEEEEEEKAYTEEEVKELRIRAERVEDLEKELQEKEIELEKFSKKDFNFRKFEGAKKDEKEKMLKRFSEKEKILIQEMSEMKSQFQGSERSRLNEVKESIFQQLGADDELKKRLEDMVKHSSVYLGEPSTTADVRNRYEQAYKLVAQSDGRKVNPLNSFIPVADYSVINGGRKKDYTSTPEGERNFNQWFNKYLPKKKQ